MDDISYARIQEILDRGISLLSPIQKSIVAAFYLCERPVTQKSFLAGNRMKKQRFDLERDTAISALRCWLISHQITGMHDIE